MVLPISANPGRLQMLNGVSFFDAFSDCKRTLKNKKSQAESGWEAAQESTGGCSGDSAHLEVSKNQLVRAKGFI